jgi:hypothetical protein
MGRSLSFTLPASYEQGLGFDGVIILALPNAGRNEVRYKIGLFEAKWPRMFGGHQHLYKIRSGNPDRWDSLIGKKPGPQESHFSNQLILQHALYGTDTVLWEQFFSEETVGHTSSTPFKKTGSTCVFHKDAYNYMCNVPSLNPLNSTQPKSAWKRPDLTNLLTGSTSHTLASIIFGMASCAYGKPVVGTPNSVTVPVAGVPLPTAYLSAGTLQTVAQLGNGIVFSLPTDDPSSSGDVLSRMRTYGFNSFTYITLSEAGKARAEEEQRQIKAEVRKAKVDEFLKGLSTENIWRRRTDIK